MPTTIRLTRMGRKKRPFYRLVVLDSRKRRDGAYLANLGYYNPFRDPFEVQIHDDEIISWLEKGATISQTARSLLKSEGVLYKYSLMKQGLAVEEIESKVAAWRQQSDANRQQKVDTAAVRKAEAEKKAEDEAKAKVEEEARVAAEAKAAEEAKAAAEEAKAAEETSAEAESAEAEESEKPAADEDGSA